MKNSCINKIMLCALILAPGKLLLSSDNSSSSSASAVCASSPIAPANALSVVVKDFSPIDFKSLPNGEQLNLEALADLNFSDDDDDFAGEVSGNSSAVTSARAMSSNAQASAASAATSATATALINLDVDKHLRLCLRGKMMVNGKTIKINKAQQAEMFAQLAPKCNPFSLSKDETLLLKTTILKLNSYSSTTSFLIDQILKIGKTAKQKAIKILNKLKIHKEKMLESGVGSFIRTRNIVFAINRALRHLNHGEDLGSIRSRSVRLHSNLPASDSDLAVKVVHSGKSHKSPISIMINPGNDIFAAMSAEFLKKFKASLLPATHVSASAATELAVASHATKQAAGSAFKKAKPLRKRAGKAKRIRIAGPDSEDESSDSEL